MQALQGIRACVFDAYGTLFDVSAAARELQAEIGPQWQALSELWRNKQLQYTWLGGLGGHHADFWQVTGEALDFALQSLAIDDPALRERLMALYLHLGHYPEVPATLRALKDRGLKLAILSNGSSSMLAAAVRHAGLEGLFEAVLSVDAVGVFKPHPSVYQLAPERLGVSAAQVCFLSSNGWDAYSAKAFGFRVLWCNRLAQAPERIPATPDGEIRSLAELPALIA